MGKKNRGEELDFVGNIQEIFFLVVVLGVFLVVEGWGERKWGLD